MMSDIVNFIISNENQKSECFSISMNEFENREKLLIKRNLYIITSEKKLLNSFIYFII